MSIAVTILGCGSSGGVPRVAQGWGVCDPANPKNRRRRCSILVEQTGPEGVTRVLVDTSPDLREQLIDARVKHLDAILMTHGHADHTNGIDDVRPLVLHMRRKLDMHMDERTSRVVKRAFGYVFDTPEGSQYPPLLRDRRISAGHAVHVEGAGLLLMGGADVDLAMYGQRPHPRTYGVDRRNDEFEITLSRAAAELEMPTLAVCRGMQVANVAFGGTLHQHLADLDVSVEVAHGPQGFPSPTEGVEHPIEIVPGSLLAKALEGHRTPPAISYHHQAVDRVGEGFTPIAWAEDGHLEAMERENGWFLCIQWHPEDTAPVDPAQQRIYDAFVEQARASRHHGR